MKFAVLDTDDGSRILSGEARNLGEGGASEFHWVATGESGSGELEGDRPEDALRAITDLLRGRGGLWDSIGGVGHRVVHGGESFTHSVQIDDEVVDDVVVSRSTAGVLPAVDICAHGGVRVVERILEALARRDAPLCEAGESRPPTWPARNLVEHDAASVMASAKTARTVLFLAWQRRHLPEELSRAASFCRTDAARAQRVLAAAMDRFDAARTLIDGAAVAIVPLTTNTTMMAITTLLTTFIHMSPCVYSPVLLS